MPKEVAGTKIYTLEEIAGQLEITVATLRGYIRNERLKAKMIGKFWYVSETNLREFIETPDTSDTLPRKRRKTIGKRKV